MKKKHIYEREEKMLNIRNIQSLGLATLRGISQVILIENAFSGFIILLAITVSSYFLGIIALLSSLIGTLVAKIGGADEAKINQGLFGYNSLLTGIALELFLNEPYQWIIALAGAAITAIVTAAIMHIMKGTGLPVLTFPYIILTWFMLLAAYRLDTFTLSPELVPQYLSHRKLKFVGETHLLEGILNGIGQIFFLEQNVSCFLILVAVCFAGWKFCIYVLLGNIIALLTALFLGAEHTLITMGLYGYNAILTILAVSVVFQSNQNRFSIILTGIFGAFLAVIMTASVSTWLLPYGLPSLTMPFVLSSWVILAARKVLPRL
ncbi:urea transporter [Metabacillus fastidiosus]|uniref:Urea transporter n=2 Tax=Metabacillus fastidiosus TaxID=1458 RepID=A0ABU6P0L7_9BACI|nr:urea transporter [Metabacillus fastidiosus]MED4402904.1 urea transporter [Metabacillus fastidiosus]